MGTRLLRIATAGSVDDGKSTLIGRLLHDSRAIMADQLAHVVRASERRHGAGGAIDLALLTDGLRDERDQGITIDVAYRYFATPRRSFIIADTPGHITYTRNMVTGASTADLVIVLIDARHGIVEQSRRHAYIAALLGIRHVVLAVNKLDLVAFDEQVFRAIVDEFTPLAAELGIDQLEAIPMCALDGDNVVEPSTRMAWHHGPTLLQHLEQVDVARSDDAAGPMRLPVQWVVRHGGSRERPDYRGYAGQVARGVVRVGDPVVVLPAGTHTTVAAIDTYDGPLDAAGAGDPVTVRLADDVDVARGDVLAAAARSPRVSRELEAMLCWMHEAPLAVGSRYRFRHATRTGRLAITELQHRVDIATLQLDTDATALQLNELGRVRLRASERLAWDAYADNRAMGSLILIDEASGATVAAGMLVEPDHQLDGEQGSEPAAVALEARAFSRAERQRLLGLRGVTVWITSAQPAGAGFELAVELARHLVELGTPAHLLADPALDPALDPAHAAALLTDAGVVAIVAAGAMTEAGLSAARELHATRDLPLVHVDVDRSDGDGAADLTLGADAATARLALVLAALRDRDLLDPSR